MNAMNEKKRKNKIKMAKSDIEGYKVYAYRGLEREKLENMTE